MGSLVIDGAMLVSLVWSWSAMATRLEALDVRIAAIEIQADGRLIGYQRLAVVETEVKAIKAQLERIETSQDRIEAKLDRIK